ncbi:MAG: DUF4102 domain-containing protein [Burkholderiaceae bacterium]|nr:DUF4102 domain-containing protein [Burkholderiaceae bacterium]
MARYLLSARQVQTAGAGDLCDGGGLLLRVQANSGAWVFRFTSPTGKRRELGLGAAIRNSIADAGKSLADARDAADAARKLLRDGRDPMPGIPETGRRVRQRLEAVFDDAMFHGLCSSNARQTGIVKRLRPAMR